MGTSVERGSSANGGLIHHPYSSSPELLTRKPHKDSSFIAEAPMNDNPKSETRSLSYLRGPKSPLHSQRKTEVADLVGKEQIAEFNESSSALLSGNEKTLSAEPDSITSEGSNLRFLKELMSDPFACSESEDLVSKSSHNKENNAVSILKENAAKKI